MGRTNPRVVARMRRRKRSKKKARGSLERPRLTVFRSNKHIFAQIVDDQNNNTLASASTLSKELASTLSKTGNIDAAKKVGELLAKKALEKNIAMICFDRNGYIYHGRVKALADAARESGLKF